MKNYFLIFFTSYLTILFTKFIFAFYLNEQFSEFSFDEIIYAIFWGIKFDFAASAILAFVVSFFDFNKKLYAYIGSISVISIFLTQISDIFYFAESSRHIGYEILDIFEDAQSLLMTAYSQYTFMTVISIFLSLIIFVICYIFFRKINTSKINKYYFLKKLFIIVITIFFIRGMFQHIPLHPWQANEIGNTQLANISLNSIYNIVYSIANQKKKVSPPKLPKLEKIILEDSIKKLYNDSQNTKLNFPIINTKPNVIFFFLEGWSAKFMSAYGYPKKTTPFYDSILEKSLSPKFMIANGRRTTEGIFATLTSFQNPLGKSVAKTQLQNFEYDSIIYEFTKNGYDSAFFQGSSKDTSGTGSLVNNLGFKQSYGKRDIKERIYDENYWGVQDTDLFNFIEKKISNKEIKEPFVLGINGATTHDLITPKGFKKQFFAENKGFNNKLNALNYSDFATGEFVKNIEEKYPNTIFVLFADHCTGSLKGNMENYMIPFIIYSNKLIDPKKLDVVLSQRDISPTIYDLVLGNSKKEMPNFTGKSIISSEKFYADYFKNGILGWIEKNDIIEINTTTNEMKCFKLKDFDKVRTTCNNINNKMKERALSLTIKSQELLFKGETKKIKEYKY